MLNSKSFKTKMVFLLGFFFLSPCLLLAQPKMFESAGSGLEMDGTKQLQPGNGSSQVYPVTPSQPPEVLSGAEARRQQTAPAQTADNAEKKARTVRSSAEQFFSLPGPLVGAAVRGPKEKLQKQKEDDDKLALQQEAILARLITSEEALPLFDKITLYLQLNQEGRQTYLQMLPYEERQAFVRGLGEQGPRFRDDLKTSEIDRNLKQFGYDFFNTTGEGFVPERQIPVGPDYIVGPGDTLVISIWGSFDANYEVTVDRGGEIFLPRVGAVPVWGQAFSQVRETLHKQISKYYKGFELNVTMGGLRSIQVYLVGEVNTPGTYTLSSLATVLNALAMAGGPSKTGSLRNVQLIRDGEIVSQVDFYDFFHKGDRSRDARLQSGDTVLVPIIGPLVGVAGDVRRPAIYELKGRETIEDALKMAGGVISTAYLKRVQVERVEAHRKRVVVDIDLSSRGSLAGENGFVLQDRDLLLVSPIAPANASYVSLNGYVAHPGRYQFVEGMRLADLITPYDNLLPNYFPSMVEILRIQPPDYLPQKLNINLAAALTGDPDQNIVLKELDEIRLFSRQEMGETPKIAVSGAVLKPGSYRYFENMTVRDAILSAGNVKRSAYLGEAEITRSTPSGRQTKTSRIHIDLGRALEGEGEHNLILEPEDHLFVRFIPDFAEERLVTIEGRVLFPGTYAIGRGETLSAVLQRAGGYASKAYLRGAVFSRTALKESQSERLQKLIFEQEQGISRVSSDIALGALSSEQVQSAKAVLESRKVLLERLKQTPVTGRMVVHLSPLDEFTGSDYDIELMDGDSLYIPENPMSVSIFGQVYNPVSMAYQAGQSVSYYLSKVGGPTENANTDDMFIVRADGTVFSKPQAGAGIRWDQSNHKWVAGGFFGTELFPGDAVLVPEEVKRFDIMREVKDITTIFYQMALGAAAVASF